MKVVKVSDYNLVTFFVKKKQNVDVIFKGFFRRSIKERAPGRYKCMDNGTCEINVSTRNGCRYCRFQRCIKVGMSVEGY